MVVNFYGEVSLVLIKNEIAIILYKPLSPTVSNFNLTLCSIFSWMVHQINEVSNPIIERCKWNKSRKHRKNPQQDVAENESSNSMWKPNTTFITFHENWTV